MASLTWFKDEENRLLNLASGPMGQYLAKLAVQVETAAKANTPVDTGRLRSSITWEFEVGDPLAAVIGTNVEYAIFVHEGARGRSGRPFLVDALHAVAG